jgi:RNA polymerase sigma-70 factor, ECF subfamily
MLESNALVTGSVAEVRPSAAASLEDQVVRLFDELRVPLLRYLSGFSLPVHDSDDVVQEAFLALFRHLRRGESHPNLRGWLFKTTHHLALKKLLYSRRDLQNGAPLGGVDESAVDPAPNPEDQFSFQQTQKRLLSVVSTLPEQNRWCLYLRAEGLRYREIAEILDISLGSVALYLERSLAHIARAAER